MNKIQMNRTQIYLTKKEHRYLKKKQKKLGLSMADIIRRIIDKHIEEKKNEH